MAATNVRTDEPKLRDPQERPLLVVSILLNFVLIGLAIFLITYHPQWLKSHPLFDKQMGVLRTFAIAALVGLPLLLLDRNRRESSVRGNSVEISEEQFPEVYAVLRSHCARLGMDALPKLFVTAGAIKSLSAAYSSWSEPYIVLNQNLFDGGNDGMPDAIRSLLRANLVRSGCSTRRCGTTSR